MDKGGGTLVPVLLPAPPQGQVYLPQWRRAFGRVVKLLREEHALAEELSLEREQLLTELDLERGGRRELESVHEVLFRRIWREEQRRRRAEKAETATLLGGKELEIHCHENLAELAENDIEDFRSCISALAAENTELKTKLKKVESQAELSENIVDHEHSSKELRKLKHAYKILNFEKDKEITALRAERSFAWNQFKTMEDEYRGTIRNKNIEARQATEAAQQLQQNVDKLRVSKQELQQIVDNLRVACEKKDTEIDRLQAELRVAGEKKDNEIDRLRAELRVAAQELQQIRSLVNDKDVKADKNKDDQPEANRKGKNDINETNRKSQGPVLREKSKYSQVTPDNREGKTSRTRTSKAQNLEERGHSETSQKRKRGSSSSRGPWRRRLLQVKTSVSPMLLPPSFTVPRLKTPC